MNEIQPPTTRIPEAPEPDTQAQETQSLARQKSRQDKIFGYSTVASLVVTFGWLAWVSNSDLFGSAANLADLKPQLIKIVKPPIPQKPKPKKKEKPPPPPPKQKPPPKVKPLKQIKPPPHPQPRLQPPRPAPPIKAVAVAHTNNKFAKPTFEAPPPAPNTELGKPIESGTAPVAPPAPPPPAPPPPAPPPPAPPPPAPPPPAPVKHVVEAPPPPPPPPPKPKIPDRNEPEAIGNIDEISLPQFDATTLNTASVTVTWEVDERGHPSSIKFRPTGNSDVDDAIRSAIQRFRFKPAVHNGVAETARMEHTFNLSN